MNMSMNYSYPTTMYESIFAQMYVFLVLHVFTIFAFLIPWKILLKKYFLPWAQSRSRWRKRNKPGSNQK